MTRTIWYVGGKSAGHIIPLITLAEQENLNPFFIVTHRDLDKSLMRDRDSRTWCAFFMPDIERKKIWLFGWYILIILGTWLRLSLLYYKTRPVKIVSTGGFLAIPVFIWAWVLRIERELFELNAVPGDAVRFLAPLSSRVYYCYRSVTRYISGAHLAYAPYPVRKYEPLSKAEARQRLGLNPHVWTIGIVGGSQGSSFLNSYAQECIAAFPPDALQIVHQTGAGKCAALREWYAARGYQAYVIDFSSTMHVLYSACERIVCRAGAGTLGDLVHREIPACIIPLKTAVTAHQIYNAQALADQKPDDYKVVLQEDALHELDTVRAFLVPELKSQLHECPVDQHEILP